MSKRHLSQQQTQRIRQLQARRITRADRQVAAVEEDNLSAPEKGLIIAHYGSQLEVEGREGEHAGQVWRCHRRSNLEAMVTGDEVVWQADTVNEVGVVTALLPRQSLLTRPDPYQKIKPVAANISLILVVVAPLPLPAASLIDRYLVACAAVGIQPLLLLNKSDLLQGPDGATLSALLADYEQLGYPVLHTSIHDPASVASLRQRISGQTVVLVGQSGVGKSSLVNTLLPDAGQRVNVISDNSLLGQHTTTTSRLFHLPDGGSLIDSPGIREFGMWHLDETQIRNGFRECLPYYGGCRFRNCQHQSEPGCALKAAVAAGHIQPRRLDSLHRLLAESKSN